MKNIKGTIGVNKYVHHSMSILDRIHELLDEKFEGKQANLAKELNKKESEISKWLNGVQNFTIFTISKLEEAFGDSIISVVNENKGSSFTQLEVATKSSSRASTAHKTVDTEEVARPNGNSDLSLAA